jgi:hypothetical protein
MPCRRPRLCYWRPVDTFRGLLPRRHETFLFPPPHGFTHLRKLTRAKDDKDNDCIINSLGNPNPDMVPYFL